MTVLRSREILPTNPTPKALKNRPKSIEPITPAQTREPNPTRRRSLRLASKPVSDNNTPTDGRRSQKRKSVESEAVRVFEEKEEIKEERICNVVVVVDDESPNLTDGEREVLSLRSGKRVGKGRMEIEGKGKGNEEEKSFGKKRSSEGKGKSKLDFGFEENNFIGNQVTNEIKRKGKRLLSEFNEEDSVGSAKGKRKFSREEKGKGKLIDDGLLISGKEIVDNPPGLESQVKISVDHNVVVEIAAPQEEEEGRKGLRSSNKRINELRTEQFRDIAKRSASRFAHFDPEEEEEKENHLPVEEGVMEMVSGEEEGVDEEIEDWPGPFSTAMKIIRDRADKLNSQRGIFSLEKRKTVPIMWIPKGRDQSKPLVPSLQELCLTILAKNADAITSLENVPDALRHKLSQMLCDSRRMNGQFFDLLVRGSPTEIRLRDCSWLTEEEFSKSFEGCDTNNLMVLQLDQCGRCMPDYILPATLARAANCLPALTTLSMSGSCRLSDVGLSALVSSAPALRSINLSQCSLLTAASIDTLANSLGSVLRELYLNDCQVIDPMLILPALKKLEHLEVLSLAGIQTVSDDFVREFIVACGHNMKELVLTDCVKLTDSSLKLIAETCSGLCVLDLSNLCKLTDSAIGYLANCCQAIHALKLCRNAFSDEAIAAYLETSGESLKELSLNNVKKVAHNTAISLARRSRKLMSLDLSWCRNLTNEAVGLIVDSCSSLRMLKLFGCTQITNVFLDGHSNPKVQIVGLKMSPVMEHLKVPDPQEAPLHYSSVFSSV